MLTRTGSKLLERLVFHNQYFPYLPSSHIQNSPVKVALKFDNCKYMYIVVIPKYCIMDIFTCHSSV